MDDEQKGYVEEMVRTRSTDLARPPWVQSHRWTAVKLEARKRIAALPPVETTPAKAHYQAARRTHLVVGTSGTVAVHEATEDGIPICALNWQEVYGMTESEWRQNAQLLGPGPVTCGHCANTAK